MLCYDGEARVPGNSIDVPRENPRPPKNEIKHVYAADNCRSSSEMISRGGGTFPLDDDIEERLLLMLVGVDSDSEEDVEAAVDGLECDARAADVTDVAANASAVRDGDGGVKWGVELDIAGS